MNLNHPITHFLLIPATALAIPFAIAAPAHAAPPGKLYAIGGFDPDDTGMVPHRHYEIDPLNARAIPLPTFLRSLPPRYFHDLISH